MGRRKNYDRDSLVAKAMEIFRDRGFAGTSTQMLVDGLGINRFSLYAEFGSKHALFEAALQRYNEEVLEQSFSPLETQDSGLPEIRRLLEFYGSAAGSTAFGRGCLLCNSAVEFGPDDPGGSGFAQRYFARVSGAFFAALNNANQNGQTHESVDARKEASFLAASILGLFVLLRAKAPATVIELAAQAAVDHVEGLRAA